MLNIERFRARYLLEFDDGLIVILWGCVVLNFNTIRPSR